jgi:hypothetical protein
LTFKTPIIGALSAAVLAFATPGIAQDAEASSGAETANTETAASEMPQIAAEDVTDEQVEGFVAAFLAVSQVRAEYLPKISEEESEDARQALVEEANAAVIEAVGDATDMDAKTYVAIGKAAETDKALSERITKSIEAAQAE